MEDMGNWGSYNDRMASPLHMVPKNSGGWRPFGDYRRLNDVTTADRYPVPHIQDFASQLAGATVFSKIDLVRGCHQIPVAADDVSITSSYEHHSVSKTQLPLGASVLMPNGHRLQRSRVLSHPSIQAMKRMAAAKFVWPGIRKQVGIWAKTCLRCQAANVHQQFC